MRLSVLRLPLLIALVLVAIALLSSGRSADAALTLPLSGGVYMDLSTIHVTGVPQFEDPFHDLQGFCGIQTLTQFYPGFPDFISYLYANEGGVIEGGCSLTDHYVDVTEVDRASVTGTLDAESGTFTNLHIDWFVSYTQPSQSQTKHLTVDVASGTLDANGSARPVATFGFQRTSVCDSCNPTTSTDSYGGTVELSLSLRPVNSADLMIDHIEVVQVVQDAGNSVPLVARKSTVARVFVKSTIPISNPQVTLKGSRGGQLGGTPQLLNGSSASANPLPLREMTDHSFNFLLPDNWTTQGAITFEAEAMTPPGVADPNADNNNGSATVTFQERSGYIVSYLPICYAQPGASTPSCAADFVINSADRFMDTIFPVADGAVLYRPLAVPHWIWPNPVRTHRDTLDILAALRKRFDLIDGTEGTVADQLAGWQPRDAANPDLGWSDTSWDHPGGTGHVSIQQDTSAMDPGDPAFTLAHEIAHNIALRHTNKTDSCGANDDHTDWPYNDSTIQEIGWDMSTNRVVPKSKFDLMTYCSPSASNIWISPFSYKKLFDANAIAHPLTAGAAGAAEAQFLVISGSARADGSGDTLDPAYVITSHSPGDMSDPSGAHCLHFAGAVTPDFCFTLHFENHRDEQPLDEMTFTFKVPLPVGATGVALMTGATELASLHASANAPNLQITAPSPGTTLTGQQTLSWTSSDSDGGPTTQAVLYSPDGGTTWLPIAVDIDASSFSYDAAELAASSNVFFRVITSDGFNTTSATVGPLLLSKPSSKGDADCIGGFTTADLTAVLGYVGGVAAPGCLAAADVNCDASVGVPDAVVMLKKLAALPFDLPTQCAPFPA
jgi:hypothetical protein